MVEADCFAPYGFVVESVNVSVLLYVPVRSGSPAPMACLKATVTGSLLTGPVQVSNEVGLAEPPTAASARAGAGRRARGLHLQRLRRALNAPLTSLPVAVVDGSETMSVASPAVLITFAVAVGVVVLGDARRERAERGGGRA